MATWLPPAAPATPRSPASGANQPRLRSPDRGCRVKDRSGRVPRDAARFRLCAPSRGLPPTRVLLSFVPMRTLRIMIWRLLSATLALTIMASGALAQTDATVRPVVFTSPTWTSPPDADVTEALSPAFAQLIGISGSAIIECLLHDDGHPFDCRVVEESVHGLGFGSAARLVVASGTLRASRVNGEITSGRVRARVNFVNRDLGGKPDEMSWPTPTPEALRLAAELAEQREEFPLDTDRMEDLDYDRRAVVEAWLAELLPSTPETRKRTRTTQLVRLFSEDDLQRILAREEPVQMPSKEAFMEACPDPTAEEMVQLRELRRRYCERYECGV